MFNSYKTIAEILASTKSINSFLVDADKYLAHTSKNGMPPEKLAAHIELVQVYFSVSIAKNKLDDVIDRLIYDFISQNNLADKENLIGNFIKKVFVGVIIFHDYGKVNENFQADKTKMNNPLFKKIAKHPLETHHSSLGAYLFIVKHLQELQIISPSGIPAVIALVLGASYNIFKHHSSILTDRIEESVSFKITEIEVMKQYILKYQFIINDSISTNFPKQTGKYIQAIIPNLKAEFSLFALLKLNFSLLTASDYLATNEYINGLKLRTEKDFGLIENDLRQRIFENIQQLQPYNKETYQKYSENYQFATPTAPGNGHLNILRQEMAMKLIKNIRLNLDKTLFYIEAPTGGGKTNLSMIATVELLNSNKELNKVFYVFPFTTLITQTYKSIIDTLGLKPDEITQLHSKAGVHSKEENEDGTYGDDKRNFIDNLFVNYPFCLLTHIKFFDILKTNEKETNYLLHRLANSVVVIDELQSYNPEHWDKLIYFIANYAKLFNVRFILMSATLPKLGNLQVFKNLNEPFVYLLGEDAKDIYFRNPNFKDRVAFNFELIESELFDKKMHYEKLEDLVNLVFRQSHSYSLKENGDHKPLGSVYTIIEFIFKKSASAFFELIQARQQNELFFDEVFVLSGTILEHRRKYIINFLKNKNKRKKRILLITTQVVEAGVDIDMDLGFKDVSLVDSDEQLAGRINRNVNKPQCQLFLFKLDEAKRIYGRDARFEFTKNKLSKEIYKTVLAEKKFDKLYDEVFSHIDKLNSSLMIENFTSYKTEIRLLNFRTISEKFKLIDQDTLSIFVPIPIPIKVAGAISDDVDTVFTDNELKFLNDAGVFTDNNIVEGAAVFDLYVKLIKNKDPDFIKEKIALKTLQGIMSKFIFSVFNTTDVAKNFEQFSDIEKNNFGFIYLEHWKEVYDECFGINEQGFKNAIFI